MICAGGRFMWVSMCNSEVPPPPPSFGVKARCAHCLQLNAKLNMK